jgi:hypothetical protein
MEFPCARAPVGIIFRRLGGGNTDCNPHAAAKPFHGSAKAH